MPDRSLRIALVGWGAIGTTVAAHLADTAVEIVAVGVRDATAARRDVPAQATLISDPADLAALRPDLVVEAAGRESVRPWSLAALAIGADVIVSSVSAFADPALLAAITEAAHSAGASVAIQPGALAGVEALAAARSMGLDSVDHRIVKPPSAWRGTPAETLCDLESIDTPTEFHRATAAQTAMEFPKNANVAMTSALAGVGPDRTTITLVADPTATTNRHELTATGGFGTLDVRIANNPLPSNPKTSALAALSLVRAIENRLAAIVI